MAIVGIIANPAASKDIRRLVAHGRVVPDWEKVNIVRRLFFGLEAAGVSRTVAMPDNSNLCLRARDTPQLSLDVEILDMPVFGSTEDSIRAAALMREMAVDCLVTLGGDGTNRAVAQGCAQVPLVPISTGTNNVFPYMIEGTLAGLAAGVVAQGLVDLAQVSTHSKRIEVYLDGKFRDLALVDVAVSRERFVATRAIWDMTTIDEVFLTRAEPTSIGLSSIGARLHPLSITDDAGLYFRQGAGDTTVRAPVAPGMVSLVSIQEWRVLPLGERIQVQRSPCTIALDGEREFSLRPGEQAEVMVTNHGPRVVLLDAALRAAITQGLFTTGSPGSLSEDSD